MRRPKPRLYRNRLDLTDRVQVRVIKRRFRITDAELSRIIAKTGNSISGISKEVALQRVREAPQPVASVAAIAAPDTNVQVSGILATSAAS
jgi:hypothetical protein